MWFEFVYIAKKLIYFFSHLAPNSLQKFNENPISKTQHKHRIIYKNAKEFWILIHSIKFSLYTENHFHIQLFMIWFFPYPSYPPFLIKWTKRGKKKVETPFIHSLVVSFYAPTSRFRYAMQNGTWNSKKKGRRKKLMIILCEPISLLIY